MSGTLTLPLKAEYFDAIRAGTKLEEYRLVTDYWRKRLLGRTYDRIVLTKGYPKAGDATRRLERPWLGYRIKTITHPHFGPHPVEVFAIFTPYRSPSEGGSMTKPGEPDLRHASVLLELANREPDNDQP